ncbi:run domain Beclin-1-interacting and cysteine-rich domain-containing protein-like [Uloborus diversus]|uniref:run domain Beclin-1-interacting and cysteine-rich domain-containing protein-like n=1 Tax=Uloborus diversus TaxID=327109 RepID=UPI00240985D9|nr:run domain Beclin-1-interacting and cysteine-rich domain-containing protein-like [Uloborus diversus]
MNDIDSRRSSTSTVRERNASLDSAYSQISIIDVKELEDIEQNEASYSGDNLCDFKELRSRSRSDAWETVPSDSFESPEMFSLPSSFSETKGIKRKSIFEGHQITVPTECFFPRPQQGQSITSFLSSNDFNISAELDRENAHFCISEALISAIEHMKWVCTLKLREAVESSEDELESQQKHTQRKFSQRIRIRRKEVRKQKTQKNVALLSDGKTDTATSQSASPPVSSHSSEFEADSIGSEEEVDDLELSAEHTESNLSSIKENGLSLSMASLYSDADIHRIPFPAKDVENKKFLDSESNNLSAESVALSLIRRFSEKHLPKASELQWLVSEQEAPQRLLPLPDSWPVSPDAIEEEYFLEKTRLRGNLDWAPPRPQIIFIIHPTLKRRTIIERQKYRCAGCGLKIEKNLMDRIRYCDYFGKYFCQCCHSNNLAYIPGRILWKWDFTKYYVSKFAWKLLDQMYSDPLFNIQDLNCNLYQKVKQLERCRVYRTQLFYLKDFIKTCRKAEFVQAVLEQQQHHMIFEPHQYSLGELVQVKSGELLKYLSQLINQCLSHVRQCILCQAKGFICEICRKDKDIIFPFQLDRVVACQKCGTCLHKKCFKNVNCPKCERIEARRKRLAEIKSDEEL